MTRPVRRQIYGIGRRRAWLIWAVGLSVYLLAVFHRTSLGVAGLLAAQRFDISASLLSTFTVLQLGVYAAMQVPVGVLLDRFGSKRLMLTGLLLMTLGQAWFAIAGTFGVGLAARVMLGAGDAMIFTSLLRLIALWFRVKQAPIITQVSSVVGQLGAVAATTPLTLALGHWGWTRAFATAASVGIVLGVFFAFIVKDSPYTGDSVEKIKVRALAHALREVWGNPGTRLAMWVHFVTMFGPTVFVMLWGFPFLVAGEGLSPAAASNLLVLMSVTAMVAGPFIGIISARMPYRRSQFVLALVVLIMTVWGVVLLWPGPAPLWLLIVLVVVVAIGGPGSMVGFDLARTFHPTSRIGRASGVVNVGGFMASLLTIGLIGLVLDHRAPGGPDTYTLDDFRVAMSVQYAFWIVGIIQLIRYRKKGLEHISTYPGAMEALRSGDALLPGLSREVDASPEPQHNDAVHTPTPEDFDTLIDDLATRHGDAFTRDEVAEAVARARAEIEPGSHHPEFVELLVAKRSRDLLHERAEAEHRATRPVLDLLFVCEHNLARSQMAAAFAQALGGEHVRVRSAGPSVGDPGAGSARPESARPGSAHPGAATDLNPLVERAMAERGITLTTPFPTGLTDDVLHSADIVVEIGTLLDVPWAKHHIRWDIVDPHGQSIDVVREARYAIEAKVRELLTGVGIEIAEIGAAPKSAEPTDS